MTLADALLLWRRLNRQVELRPRERLLLLTACLTVGIALLWRPLEAAHERALARIARQEALIAVMRGDEAHLRSLAAAAPAGAAVPAGTAVTQEAATADLTIQRLEHDGARLRVTLDNARYSALIAWLNQLETKHGLRTVGLELDRRPSPGVVSARVTLEE